MWGENLAAQNGLLQQEEFASPTPRADVQLLGEAQNAPLTRPGELQRQQLDISQKQTQMV